MERFVVVAVDSTCDLRKPSTGSSRAARCRSRERSSLVMTKDASRLSNHALRSLRSLQCLRHRESKALPSSRRMAPRTPGFPDPASPFQSARPPSDPPAVPGGLKGRAAVDPSWARQAPQRSEERSEPRSGRAPRGLSRLSQVIPRPIPLNHPCHARLGAPGRVHRIPNREVVLAATITVSRCRRAPGGSTFEPDAASFPLPSRGSSHCQLSGAGRVYHHAHATSTACSGRRPHRSAAEGSSVPNGVPSTTTPLVAM